MSATGNASSRCRSVQAAAVAAAMILNAACAAKPAPRAASDAPVRVANDPEMATNDAAGASGESRECSQFRAKYRGPLLAALSIPRSGALKGRSIAIVDTESGGAAVHSLELGLAAGDSWRSPTLASLAVELRKVLATRRSRIQELVAAFERGDVGGYRTATDRLNDDEQAVRDADARFRSACSDPLAPDGGRMRPDVIQGVVRAHYDLFRKCYEAGLARNPALEGGVQVRFVIDRSGAVSSAEPYDAVDAKDPLRNPEHEAFWTALEVTLPRNAPFDWIPDPQVVSCVVENYRTLRFPPPEGNGVVTVVYPIQFSPG
jgi:hypothetical protein